MLLPKAKFVFAYRGNWSYMLNSTEKNTACLLLMVTVFAGFLVPGLSEIMAPLGRTSLFLMIILSLVPMGRLDFSQVFSIDKKVWQVVAWQLFVLPSIILAIAHLAKLNGSITSLMIITASAGSLFASPTFAELLQVNKQRALQCMILSTFLMPLSYFVFFTLVLHSEVKLDLDEFTFRCAIFLGFPFGLFLVYMGFARAIPTRSVEFIELNARRLTILALMIFGLGRVGAARELMYNDFGQFAVYLAIVSGLGIGMAYLTAIVMFKQGMNDAVTASIVSGFRNVGLGFVLLSGVTSIHTDAYVGVSQIPIFLAPLLLNFLVAGKQSNQSQVAIA